MHDAIGGLLGRRDFLERERESNFVQLDGEDKEERGCFKCEGRENTKNDAAINEEREGEGKNLAKKKRDPSSRWRHVSHPNWASTR